MSDLTQRSDTAELFAAWQAGDGRALDRLIPLVVDDLRGLARSYLARESPGHTLEPTALVHEAYLRLVGRRKLAVANRVQLFSALAETMRRILVDHARRKKAARHGGGAVPLALDEILHLPQPVEVDLIALDEALGELASFAPRQHQAIQLSYFAGLTFDEIAAFLEVSPVTVKRDLKAARMWLLHQLRGPDSGGPG